MYNMKVMFRLYSTTVAPMIAAFFRIPLLPASRKPVLSQSILCLCLSLTPLGKYHLTTSPSLCTAPTPPLAHQHPISSLLNLGAIISCFALTKQSIQTFHPKREEPSKQRTVDPESAAATASQPFAPSPSAAVLEEGLRSEHRATVSPPAIGPDTA